MAEGERGGNGGATRSPWYADGLRFECQPDCGACCTNHDDHTFVYLEKGEAQRLADFLTLDLEEFLARFTELDEEDLVLRMDQPDCPFLDGSRCSVYPVRPIQCSTFPFWRENLLSSRHWRRVGRFCPGVGKGERVDLVSIRRALGSRKI
jgi:Fe-S-cluster containining protein